MTILKVKCFFRMCVLGKRLLKDIDINNCTKIRGGPLEQIFCANKTCDPYYTAHEVQIVNGIKVCRKISNKHNLIKANRKKKTTSVIYHRA